MWGCEGTETSEHHRRLALFCAFGAIRYARSEEWIVSPKRGLRSAAVVIALALGSVSWTGGGLPAWREPRKHMEPSPRTVASKLEKH